MADELRDAPRASTPDSTEPAAAPAAGDRGASIVGLSGVLLIFTGLLLLAYGVMIKVGKA